MVLVLMRNQNVPQTCKRHTRGYELASDAVTTIDYVGGVIDDDDLRGHNSVRPGSRPTTCTEQNEAGSSRLLSADKRETYWPNQHSCAGCNEVSAIHHAVPCSMKSGT
jgi:hypothetical protein